jgi:hypothetical protein
VRKYAADESEKDALPGPHASSLHAYTDLLIATYAPFSLRKASAYTPTTLPSFALPLGSMEPREDDVDPETKALCTMDPEKAEYKYSTDVDLLARDTTEKALVARTLLSVDTASTAKPVDGVPAATYTPQPFESAYVVGDAYGPSTRTAAKPDTHEELTFDTAPVVGSTESSPDEDATYVVEPSPTVSMAAPYHESALWSAGLNETVPRQEIFATV